MTVGGYHGPMDGDDVGFVVQRDRGRIVALVGLGAAALPFLASVSRTTSIDGEVTYRDWIAIGGGAIAAACGVIALVLALRPRKGATLGLAALAVVGGGLQLARGFGAFGAPDMESSSTMRLSRMSPPMPMRVPMPASDPARCWDAAACGRLAAKLDKTNPKSAATAFARGCEFGDKRACWKAGQAWANGKAGPRDPKRAVALFQKACDLGNPEGCSEAAVFHYQGDGVPKDEARALELVQKGCDGGAGLACKNLAIMYRDAKPPQPDKALHWAVRTCEGVGLHHLEEDGAAIAWACDYAGGRLLDDKGKPDHKRALAMFENGCRYADSHCYNLGLSYDLGIGGQTKDPARARELYAKACGAGIMDACNNLGDCWNKGRGGKKDVAKAKQLFQKACDHGNKLGCDNLAVAKKH